MYELGYWAEATSLSPSEQEDGVKDIEKELLGRLEHVEQKDPRVSSFFRRFDKVVVIDRANDPVFSQERLASWLNFDKAEQVGNLRILRYSPR